MNPWHEAHRGHRFEAQDDGIACLDCGGVFPWPEGDASPPGRATPTAQDAGRGASPEAVAEEAERNPCTLTAQAQSVHPPPAGRLAHWPTPQAFDAVELERSRRRTGSGGGGAAPTRSLPTCGCAPSSPVRRRGRRQESLRRRWPRRKEIEDGGRLGSWRLPVSFNGDGRRPPECLHLEPTTTSAKGYCPP